MVTPACFCRASLLFCCGLLCCVCLASAQSLGLAGAASVDAAPETRDRVYEKPKFISSSASVSKLLSFSFPISNRQAFTVSTELMRLSTFYVKTPDNSSNPDWKFRGVPITLGYEYTLADPWQRVVPVLGLGVSTYYCSTSSREGVFNAEMGTDEFARSSGFGYGLQATLGLRGNINSNFFVQAQGRYRLINGHAFSDGSAPGANFPLFDFAVGFGVRL